MKYKKERGDNVYGNFKKFYWWRYRESKATDYEKYIIQVQVK